MAKKASKSTENIKLQKQFIDKYFPDLSKILNTSGSDGEFKKAIEDHKDALIDKFKEIGFDAGDASLEEIAKDTYNYYVDDLWIRTYDARKKLSDRDPDYWLFGEALEHIEWCEGQEDFNTVDKYLPKGALRNALIRHGIFNEEEGPEDDADVDSEYFKEQANNMAEYTKRSRSRGIKDLKRGPISKSKGKSADTLDTLRYHFRNKLEDENPELAKKFVDAKSLNEIKDLVNNNRDSLKGFMDSIGFRFFDKDEFANYAKYTNGDVKGLMRDYGKEGSLHDVYNNPEDLAKGFGDVTLSEFNKTFGLLGKRIKKEDVEEAIENKPNEVIQSDMPEPAKVEARQIVDDNDKRNDEANDNNVEAATKELQIRNVIPGSEPDPLGVNISNEERSNWNGGEDRAVGDATLSEMDNALASRTRPVKPGSEMLESAKPKGLLGAGMLYSRDNNIPKPSEERPLDANNLEQITESNPEAVQEALPNTPIAEEARQITNDSDARNDEVNNEAAEETVNRLSDDFETVDDLYNYLENYGMGWNNGRVDDVDLNGPDFPVDNNVYVKDEDFVGPDEVVDYGLEDQNQYPDVIGDQDETVVQDNVPEVNENDFVKSDVLPSADNVLELKPEEQEAVTEDIEENVPEEEKEETKKRRHKPIKLLSGNSKSITGGSNIPSEKTDISTKQQSSNIQSAGKNILGNVGASSGVTASRIPSVKEEKKPAAAGSTASRAAGGSMPVANEGNYAAVSHSNGGNMSSGSAGSGMFGKVGTLGKGGAITSKKANLPSGESKGGSSVLQSPQGVKNSNMNMNILSLRDKIIAKSKAWPGQRLDKGGLLIVVRDDNRVFINRQLFENFIKDNPKSVQYLRQIVDKY